MPRCEALHPASTRPSQCERPAGHAGDHVAVCWSGGLKIYPSKWAGRPKTTLEKLLTESTRSGGPLGENPVFQKMEPETPEV